MRGPSYERPHFKPSMADILPPKWKRKKNSAMEEGNEDFVDTEQTYDEQGSEKEYGAVKK